MMKWRSLLHRHDKPHDVEVNLSSDQAVVALTRNMLAEHGIALTSETKLLDFGCGAGRHVYEFRDAGVDARGFDKDRYVNLRRPEDAALFAWSRSKVMTEMPYEDGAFDVVHSTSVLEHVVDYEAAFREISRVLR